MFMKRRIQLLSLVIVMLLASCEDLFTALRKKSTSQKITIDPAQTYQTIRGFAASDAWCPDHVGKYWNEPEKEQIARWLFSQEFDDEGNPAGIGLSMWRFNLGAGTEEQGDASGIKGENEMRRAECFLDAGGGYDWTKQAGQQYFLRKARDYGCESFVAFSNSPPLPYTRNDRGYANGDGRANLRADYFDDFAVYMAEVAEHFREEGIVFDYISPVNEPQYNWNGTGQEGSPWNNDEIKKLAVELDKAISERGLPTKIMIPEAADWTYLYQDKGGTKANQIYEFFSPKSANYVGNLSSMAKVIGGHSYWTHTTNETLRQTRELVKAKAEEFGVEVFQTEWSLLGDSGQGVPAPDDASYMDIGLFTAKMIYSDLVFAEASSWSYWTSMDVERWGHKDRFLLVALAPGVKEFEKDTILKYNINQPGAVKDYPTLWALGNYSRFVRPGFTRINIEGTDNLAGLMGTAYLSEDASRIVVVYVNMATESVDLEAVFQDNRQPTTISRYLTDETHNLSFIPAASVNVSLPPRAILTVVYDF
jgi:O-glycosyl hydrolase